MPLDGKRVLIAEDEYLIALDLVRELEDAGAKVIGPVGAYSDAIAVIEDADLDGAIIDVALQGFGRFFSVADALADRGIPFVFLTGLITASQVPALHAGAPFLEKPAPASAVCRALQRAMIGGVARV